MCAIFRRRLRSVLTGGGLRESSGTPGENRSGFAVASHCNTFLVVKVEVDRRVDRETECSSCGAPLLGRQGRFRVKYFLCGTRDAPSQEAGDRAGAT